MIHIINHSSGVNICPKKSETACHWFLGYFETICVGEPGFKTVLSTHVNWNLLNFFLTMQVDIIKLKHAFPI